MLGCRVFMVFVMIVGSVAVPICAEETVVMPARTPEQLLPPGAKIHRNPLYDRNDGQHLTVLCQQPAVYEIDLDGDGALETMVLYDQLDPKGDDESLHVAIFRVALADRGVREPVLVQQLALPGAALCRLVFADLGSDGKLEACFSSTMGLTFGSHVSLVSHVGDKGAGHFVLSDAKPRYQDLEGTRNGLRAMPFSEDGKPVEWKDLRVTKDEQGGWKFDD